jgi:hypothetical protein
MDKILKVMLDYARSLEIDAKTSKGELQVVRMDLSNRINGWIGLINDLQLSQTPSVEEPIETPNVVVETMGGSTNSKSAKSK